MDKEPLRVEDMDVVGHLFGIRFVPDGCSREQFELYIEDDESYHYQFTANRFWLFDLKTVASKAENI